MKSEERVQAGAVQAGAAHTGGKWRGSRAVKVGSTIYVAGTMGVRPDGTLVSEVNLPRQVEAAYENLRNALGQFGASLANVVSETVFVTDIDHPYVMEMVGRTYADQATPPARTICQVEKLLLPNAMIAVACVADLSA